MDMQVNNIISLGNDWLGLYYYSLGFSKEDTLKKVLDIKFIPFSIKIEFASFENSLKIGFFNKFYIGFSFGLLRVKKLF